MLPSVLPSRSILQNSALCHHDCNNLLHLYTQNIGDGEILGVKTKNTGFLSWPNWLMNIGNTLLPFSCTQQWRPCWVSSGSSSLPVLWSHTVCPLCWHHVTSHVHTSQVQHYPGHLSCVKTTYHSEKTIWHTVRNTQSNNHNTVRDTQSNNHNTVRDTQSNNHNSQGHTE